jgi:hypothetical protein
MEAAKPKRQRKVDVMEAASLQLAVGVFRS